MSRPCSRAHGPAWMPGTRGDALLRGLRVALVVPLTLFALTHLPWVWQGALFGVFACLSLLVFADFTGSLPRRTAAYPRRPPLREFR